MADKEYVTPPEAQMDTAQARCTCGYQRKIAVAVSTWVKDGETNVQDVHFTEKVTVAIISPWLLTVSFQMSTDIYALEVK